VYVYMYVCIYVCMYIYMYIYIYGDLICRKHFHRLLCNEDSVSRKYFPQESLADGSGFAM
jgi:hypothetical protein